MIISLMEWFTQILGWDVPAVFTYYSTRMICATITAFFLTVFLGPFFIRKLRAFKIGQSIRSTEQGCAKLGELHQKKQNTPTMGGVLILFAMLASMFLWMDLSHVFTLLLFLATVILGAVGGWDDYLKVKHRSSKGIPGKVKLLAQCGVGALVACYLLVPQINESLQHGKWFAPPLVKEHWNQKHPTRDNGQINVPPIANANSTLPALTGGKNLIFRLCFQNLHPLPQRPYLET